MDDKTCDLVMSSLLNIPNNKPGLNLSIQITDFGELFPGLSVVQVLPVLKLLTDQGVIKATNLEGSCVQIFMPAAAFGYFDAKKAAEAQRSKQKWSERRCRVLWCVSCAVPCSYPVAVLPSTKQQIC